MSKPGYSGLVSDVHGLPDYEAERDRLKELCGELLVACKNYMENLEAGILVRDITRDHESGWAIRMLTFTTELEECQNAIAKANGVLNEKGE